MFVPFPMWAYADAGALGYRWRSSSFGRFRK
jgi:hypothetical protein